MPDEVQDANAVSSPAPDAVAASSAESQVEQVEQVAAPAPAPAPSFNMPPEERWNELRQRQAAAEERANRAEAMARAAIERFQSPQPQAQPVDVDPYAGMDPQTAQFYRDMDRRIEAKAKVLAQQQVEGVLQAVNAGRQELASMKIAQFRKENPEIKPGSAEEQAIAGLVGQGYDLDTAKKLATYDRLETENQALKSKQSSVGQKVAANQTGPTQGMPATAGLPGRPGDWRENVRQAVRKGGNLADIVNAAGASRAP